MNYHQLIKNISHGKIKVNGDLLVKEEEHNLQLLFKLEIHKNIIL